MQSQALQQGTIERRFDRSYRHIPVVARAICSVPGCRAVEGVVTPLAPESGGAHAHGRGGQRCNPVDDGAVDDLTAARTSAVDQCRHHAHGDERASARVVAEEVQRRHGRPVRIAHGMQGTAERDVVDVVTGPLGEWPALSPSGDVRIDQARVALLAHLRAEAEALGDTGPHAFQQHIGLFDELQRERQALWFFQIECDAALPAPARIGGLWHRNHHGLGPVDDGHFAAEVGQQHGGVRTGSERRQVHDPDARQRACGRSGSHQSLGRRPCMNAVKPSSASGRP